MHSDARSLPAKTKIEGDICIIGAGAAGITIAREFIGTKYDVILLEAGGFDHEPSVQSLYEGKNTGLPYSLRAGRLRYFGGTTNHWAGYCSTLDPIDFEKRDWVPKSGWPLSLSDLEPYYRRAHPLCDLGEYNYSVDHWEKRSDDFSSFLFRGPRVRTKVFKWSAPTRFGQKFQSEITQAENLTLWTHANVTDIQTVKDHSSVTGLKVQCLNGKHHRVEASQYVLACGGLENPRLLLANDIGDEAGLVGQYFMEHPHVNSGKLVLSEWPSLAYLGSPPREAGKAFALLTLGEEKQREDDLLNYTAFLRAESYDWSLPGWAYEVPKMRSVEHRFKKYYDRYVDYYIGSPPVFNIESRIEQRPNSNSKVTLSDDTDALGQPKIELHWSLTEMEKHTIREATETIAKEVGRHGIGRVKLEEWITKGGTSWPDSLRGGWHHMGTTRMSESGRRGVVNPDCRVYGVQNLFVAGSSVYPTSGTANPTLTLLALAIRLADHLKTENGR